MKKMMLLLVWIFFASACAHPAQDQHTASPDSLSDKDFVLHCHEKPDCDLELFTRASRIFRPSKGEAQMRDALLATFAHAHAELWKNDPTVTSQVDAAGNLMIRLPATGLFVQKPHPIVTLQSHMDMVFAVKDAKPGEDRAPYFKHGVEVEETAGWLHSKNYETTLGADDGIGIAIELGYLLNPARIHPPLALLFTTDEEAGMSGIRDLALPIEGEEYINLDSPDAVGGAIVVGSMGSKKAGVRGEIALSPLPEHMQVATVSLSGLRGGHSGVDIHFDRVNAIQAFTQIFLAETQRQPQIWLLEVKSGGVLNQIPTGFSATIAFPASVKIDSLRDQLTKRARQIILAHRDEEQSPMLTPFTVNKETTRETGAELSVGLPPDRLRRLLQTLERIPVGVLKQQAKYPDRVQFSSNLATLMMTPISALTSNRGRFALLDISIYSRSFVADDLTRLHTELKQILPTPFLRTEHFTPLDNGNFLSPWMADLDSNLIKKVMANSHYYSKTSLCAGGLETSVIASRYPHLQLISMGANVENPHTVNERVETKSILNLSMALERILAAD